MQIFVLGMHRSGTSVVTRLINLMGAHFGSEELSTGANQENPKGFWERRDVRDENDAVLWASGADWWKVADFSLERVPVDAHKRFNANVSKIVRELDGHRPWVIKEPRLCLLLPMWQRHVETPICVLVHRPPIQVAHSLVNRNEFPLSVGVALWERYVLDALKSSTGLPRILVSFEDIMADPIAQVDQLLGNLTAAGVDGLSRPSDTDITSFVSPDLFRHRHPKEEQLDLLNSDQLELANAMESDAVLEFGDIPKLSAQAERTLRLFEEISENERSTDSEVKSSRSPSVDREESQMKRHEPNSDLATIRAQAMAHLGESRHLQKDFDRLSIERKALKKQGAADRRQIEKLLSRLDDTEEALAAAHAEQELSQSRLVDLNTTLSDERAEQKTLKTRTEKAEIALARTNNELGSAQSRLRDFEQSTEELLVFLRRAQRHFEEISNEPAWRFGPIELRSSSRSTNTRNSIVQLLSEIGQWIRKHREELIAMLDQADQAPTPHQASASGKSIRASAESVAPTNYRLGPSKEEPKPQLQAKSRAEKRRLQAPDKTHKPTSAEEIAAGKRRRFVVYTAVAGGYDKLKIPHHVSPSVDYVCFTDREIESHNIWQLRHFDYYNVDPTRMARLVKLHPHHYLSEYESSMWLDANLLLKGDPGELFDIAADQPISAFIHPHRDCIYEEAIEILDRGGLDDDNIVSAQVERYKADGFPRGFGLAETNVLIRRHNNQIVRDLMTRWWAEILKGSRRDQLSFTYALWRAGMSFNPIAPKGISVRNDPRFERFLHEGASTYDSPRLSGAHLTRAKELTASQNAFGVFANNANTTSPNRQDLNSLELDVIVCVHDSLNEIRRCLNSIVSTLENRHTLIIVDDGSGEETARFLRRFATTHNQVRLVRQETAGGYTKAANCGIKSSTAEFLILLNSDTQVPKNWLKKLAGAAYQSGDTGIVGPLSNAASWQSVPDIVDGKGRLAVNKIPAGLTVEDLDRMAESCFSTTFPRVDLANGFCFGIKRAVLDKIGPFDEGSFPRGYGEENDFCFRAADAGFGIVIAANCYVFHEKSKSYTAARRDELALEGSKTLRQMYPASRIGNAVESCKKNPLLVTIREDFRNRIAASVRDFEKKRKSRLSLRTIDEVSGGVVPAASRQPGFFDLPSQNLAENKRIVERYLTGPRQAPRRVLWFVPAFDHVLRGGIRTIFSVAEDFSRCWGTQNLFALYGHVKNIPTDSLRESITQNFAALDFDLLTVADGQDPSTLPESDVAFCTLWTSAYLLAKYNKCQGKFYFAQDFEPSFYRAGTTYGFVEGTYRLGFPVIGNSVGVAQEVRRRCETVGYFTPGLDRSVFHPGEPILNGGAQRVVFYGRPGNPRNAFELGISALGEVKYHFGDDVQIVSVGADFDPRDFGLHGLVENWGVLGSMKDVADLYRSSSVGLVFMFSAHPSYQPLEFMGCGCATVTNWNPSTTWLLKHRKNALLVDPMTSPVANAIISLLDDQKLRNSIAKHGLDTVRKMKWEKAYSRVREFVLHPSAHSISATTDSLELPPPPPDSGLPEQ